MGADVKRRIDALRNDHLRLQILRVIHFVAGISDPSRGMHVHHMAHVDDFHRLPLRSRSTISFIAAQIPAPRTRSALPQTRRTLSRCLRGKAKVKRFRSSVAQIDDSMSTRAARLGEKLEKSN